MKAQLRRYARGLRRRLSNLAWGLGGGSVATLLIAGFVRNMLSLPRLPEFLNLSVNTGICLSIVAAIAAFVASAMSRVPRYVSVSADSRGIRVDNDGRVKGYDYDEVGGVLRHRSRAWVILRNGNVDELLFDEEEEAKAFAAAVRGQIGEGRIELVPRPTAMTALWVLVAMLTMCSMTSVVAGMLEDTPLFGPVALGTVILAAARLAMALRGQNFVLGLDGLRVGKKFVPLSEITAVQIAKDRVNVERANGDSLGATVRLPDELAKALNAEFAKRLQSEPAGDEVLRREEGEEVHAWLQRVRGSIRETSFRNPGVQKERVRVAALHPKSPLRVRVAALAGLMEEDPELAEELLAVSADPRLKKAAKAAQGSADGWRRAVERLERDGALE